MCIYTNTYTALYTHRYIHIIEEVFAPLGVIAPFNHNYNTIRPLVGAALRIEDFIDVLVLTVVYNRIQYTFYMPVYYYTFNEGT